MSELPSSWVEAPVSGIAAINPPRPETPVGDDDLVSFVPMASVQEESGVLDATQLRPWREVNKGYTKFQEGDVLFAKITPCMENGKFALAEKLHDGVAAGSTEFHVLRPTALVRAKYLLNFLLTSAVRRDARMIMKGAAGQLRVPSSFFDQLNLPIAPPPEQDRIVAEIEKQFTRLDAATAALKRVQANLKRYRASVLKAACEGRLVCGEQTSPPYPTIPVAEILRVPLANGRSPKGSEEGCRILRLTAIKKGRVDPSEFRMGIVTKALIGNLSIRPNDILISRGNGSKSLVGLAGLVGTVLADTEPVLFPDTMIRARLKGELCDPRFFALIWNSRFVRDQIERTARTTAGIHKISQADIERFQIPLPPIVEQAVIVGAAETALSNVQHTEEALTRLLARSASLRAAVLTDAFSGRLIPQDPSDEPASALLERIRAVRTGTPNPPVRRGHEKLVHA